MPVWDPCPGSQSGLAAAHKHALRFLEGRSASSGSGPSASLLTFGSANDSSSGKAGNLNWR